MEVLVESICRMVPDAAMPDVLALVLGRIADERMAGVYARILLEALL
jgi:hypothetical protein